MLAAARAAKRVLPDDAINELAEEVVARLASRIGRVTVEPRLDVSIEAFCAALISPDAEAASRIIAQERRDGVPLDVVYLHTLSGAARHLGVMWEKDEVSFLGLTVAAGRIFEIMRGLRQEVPQQAHDPKSAKRAFFAAVPGETHTLGVTMAAALLRNHGWAIELRTGMSHDALVEAIAADDQKMIGLSAGRAEGVVALIRLVLALRIVKPEAKIIVCGHVVSEVRGLVELVNADAVIEDTGDVTNQMDALLAQYQA